MFLSLSHKTQSLSSSKPFSFPVSFPFPSVLVHPSERAPPPTPQDEAQGLAEGTGDAPLAKAYAEVDSGVLYRIGETQGVRCVGGDTRRTRGSEQGVPTALLNFVVCYFRVFLGPSPGRRGGG